MVSKEILERALHENSRSSKTASHKPELRFRKSEYDPLIPSSILDIHTQKIYFIILFLLLQVSKIQQCLILQLGNSFEENAKIYFILKFFVADSIFLWLLPVFRVPTLTFNPLFTLLLSIAVTCFTVFLSTNLYQMFSSVVLSVFALGDFSKKSSDISNFDNNGGSNILNSNSNSLNFLKGDNVEVLALHQPHLGSDDAYFKGKKNINILPKSISYFNPFDEQHCLGSPSSIFPNIESKITIPLKFNTTNEVSQLELMYTDFNNITTTIVYNKKQMKSMQVPKNSAKFSTYVHSDIKQNPSHYGVAELKYNNINSIIESLNLNRVCFLEVPIENPGLYRVSRVTDSRNLPIKILESSLLISQCPSVALEEANPSDRDYSCLGDHHNLNIKLTGVPPMRVKYSQLCNVDSEIIEQILLQPEVDLKSPLVDAAANWESSKKTPSIPSFLHKLDKSDINSFFVWANNYEINIPILNIVKFAGDYSYNIEEVEDGFGNIIKISDIEKTLTKNIKKDRNYLENYLAKENLLRTFVSYDSPSLKLVDSHPNKPLMEGQERQLKLIVDSNDSDMQENTKKLKQIEPIVVNITYFNSIETVLEDNDPQNIFIKDYVFDSSNDFTFTTTDPGTFLLTDVRAGYCPALLDDGNKRIEIFKAFKPELSILSSSPINITCIGQVGTSFDLLFTGVPPFKLEINNYDLDDNKKLIDTEYLRIASNRYQYDFQPKQKSNVEIEFKSISDDVYRDFIPLESSDKYRFRTSLNTKPTVAFSESFDKTLCLNSSSEILPVVLSGGAPFEITYDIIEKSSNRRKPYTAKNITGYTYDLKLPVFTKGGEYIVSLTSVEDNKACLILVSDQKANINVKNQLPYAEFRPIIGGEVVKEKNVNVYTTKIKEGKSIDLPVKLVGEGQMTLEFVGVDDTGNMIQENTIKRFTVSRNKHFAHDEISVSKAGTYQLASVRDNLCNGIVNENAYYNISYYPKPELIINESKGSRVKKMASNLYFKDDICVNEIHNTIDLVFKGQAPFAVDYIIVLPNGGIKSKSIKVSSNFLSIDILGDLDSSERSNGKYKYIFKSLSDNVYSKKDLLSLPTYRFSDIIIEQEIFSVPSAKFNGKHKVIPVCSNQLDTKADNTFVYPLTLGLEGSPPFNIELSLFNENFNKFNTLLINSIDTNEIDLINKVVPYLSLGGHVISIVKVTDGKGCVNDNFINNDIRTINNNKLSSSQIAISVSDIPKISKITTEQDLCVGDYVQYKLHGTGPFFIEYEFQSQIMRAIVKDNYEFTRLLGEPGSFTIVSIKDTFNCQATLDSEERRNLMIDIHEKPTVEIINSNDENIQEGDEVEIIFKFTGSAPFDMIYRRSFNNMKDFEIIHADNIETDEYRIKTSLQGSYEAIEVRDTYCEIRRNI